MQAIRSKPNRRQTAKLIIINEVMQMGRHLLICRVKSCMEAKARTRSKAAEQWRERPREALIRLIRHDGKVTNTATAVNKLDKKLQRITGEMRRIGNRSRR